MKWIKKEKDNQVVKNLMHQYQLSPLVASLMARRGFTEGEELLYFLEKKERYLLNPFLFMEMESAVDRILEAIEDGEKIKIFGDRDVDGITSTVIIYSAIKELGADIDWSVPTGDDDYGLTMEKVKAFADEGGTLIVTVDCGISNHDEIAYAGELGVDVIVTDHHNPPAELPDAVALLNPKLEDSGYPFEHLAGCAVSFKLALALELSKAPFYKHQFTLLNIEEIEGGYRFDVMRVSNLVCLDKISEVVVPGVFRLEGSRLKRFLVGAYIIVYDAPVQSRYLKACFGQNVEIEVRDLKKDIATLFPTMATMSLLQIKNKSHLLKYTSEPFTYIDALYNLYVSCELAQFPSYSQKIDRYIDLVTIGTLADLMPLVNENRLLVSLGVQKINNKEKQGEAFRKLTSWTSFMRLLQDQKLLEKPISVMDLVYKITPVINATGRLGVPDKAVRFFLEPESPELANRSREILSINEERKKIVAHLWDRYLSVAKKSYDSMQGRFVILAGKEIHRGVTGLLASRLSEYFQAPSMVVCFLDRKAIGSVRSHGGLNIKDLLGEFEDYYLDFGGHDFAAGFSMEPSRWEDFQKHFVARVGTLEPHLEEGSIEIDAELPSNLMTPQIAEEVFKLEPFGEGFPVCNFVVRKVRIESIQIIGKTADHVRMTLGIGNYKWVGLYWGMASRVGIDFKEGDFVDVLFHFNMNFFKNQTTAQLQIQDIKQWKEESPYTT